MTIANAEIVKISGNVMRRLREDYPNDEIELGFNWNLSVAVAYELGRQKQREIDAHYLETRCDMYLVAEAIRNNTGDLT